jgi:hypothetical protein
MENISKLRGDNRPLMETIDCLRPRRDENLFHREEKEKLGSLISTTIVTFLREGFR